MLVVFSIVLLVLRKANKKNILCYSVVLQPTGWNHTRLDTLIQRRLNETAKIETDMKFIKAPIFYCTSIQHFLI